MKQLRKLFVVFMIVALTLSASTFAFAESDPGPDQRPEMEKPGHEEDHECCDDEACEGDCEHDEACEHCGDEQCNGDCEHEDTVKCNEGHHFLIEIQAVSENNSNSVKAHWYMDQEVYFMVTVTNTSDAPMNAEVEVDDGLVVGSGNPIAMINGLAAGSASVLYFSKSYPVSGGPGLRVTEASASATWPCCDSNEVYTKATEPDAWIHLEPQPELSVVKSSPQEEWNLNDEVAFSLSITNTGDVTLEDFQIIDDLIGYDSGILDLVLEPDEIMEIDLPYTYLADTPGELTNTAVVYAYYIPEVEGDSGLRLVGSQSDCGLYTTMVSAIGEVTVTINDVILPLIPGVTLEKSAPEEINLGEAIVYTFTITNTGDTMIDLVELVDDTLPGSPFDLSDTTLDIDEVYTFNVTLPGVDVSPLLTLDNMVENVATVTADSSEGPLSDTDEANVKVIYPEITVTKTTQNSTYYTNAPVTYNLTITNSGSIDFFEVWLYDDDNAGNLFIFDELFEATQGNSGPGLAAGESVTVTISHLYDTIQPNLINYFTAEGYYVSQSGEGFVEDDAQVEIAILSPAVSSSNRNTTANTDVVETIDETVIPEPVPVEPEEVVVVEEFLEADEPPVDILDDETPQAEIPATGGLPIVVPMIGGMLSTVTGLALKKKK